MVNEGRLILNDNASIVISIVLTANVLGCEVPAPSFQGAHRDAIRDSVGAAMTQFARYSSAAQWDSLAELYSASTAFRFLESGVIQYRSQQSVRAGLDDLPPGMNLTTTYQELEIDPVAPGVAMVTGLFTTTLADSTGFRFGFEGALSLLWTHEADGWRIRSGHSSALVPREQ